MADDLDSGRHDRATMSLMARGGASSDRAYLIVFEAGSSSTFPLDEGAEVVIGRAEDADVQLAHASVSRRHACIRLRKGAAEIEDLGSHNGTRVNGERIETVRPLAPEDMISLGRVSLAIQYGSQASSPHPILDPATFRQRLLEELERSLAYERPATVIAIETRVDVEPGVVGLVVATELRLMDLVAGSPREILVLLPELSAAEALAVGQRLVRAIAVLAPGVRAGCATSTGGDGEGYEVDALLERARGAARTAPAGSCAAAAGLSTSLVIGEHTALLADPAMLRIFHLLRRLATGDLPVLVFGDTGVGKELAASAIHHWSRRAARPLVTINCAAIHENLLESELFGYEKGAFTGAVSAKQGRLESARGGTVFLDEVGELTPGAQAKLLRVLEAKRVSRLGAVTEQEIDIRLVAATNRDLEKDVEAGRFRSDLFFRLGAATVTLPPLRERPRDLPLLARAFLEESCRRGGRGPIALSPETLQTLERYSWPGNVRELKNLMDYLTTVVVGPVAAPEDLPAKIRAGSAPRPGSDGDGPQFKNLGDELRELERARILEALEAAGGVQTRAAELIGMPVRTFVTKLKQHAIVPTSAGRRGRPPGGG